MTLMLWFYFVIVYVINCHTHMKSINLFQHNVQIAIIDFIQRQK